MPPTISVVIPTFNSGSVIGECLASINGQSCPPVNVIVCDGGSTDDTVEIATSLGATVVQSVANRSAQRNAGAISALGDYIVFIDSDMRLTPRVLEDCVSNLSASDAALVIPEVDIGKSYWARVRGFERSFYRGAWWLMAARCYRKEQFLQIGGFDVSLIGPEDWDLDERIRSFGAVREISSNIEHNEGHIDLGGLMKKKTHYAQSFSKFRDRHPRRAELCLSGRRRVMLFVSRPVRLLAHPILTVGLTTMGVSEVVVARGWTSRWRTDSREKPLPMDGNPIPSRDDS
jgi:glycosyltransferase involved in cell wall biosynthesis